MSDTFKPGDKVRHDGNEQYVYFGGPVEGVVAEAADNSGLVGIDAVPVGEDPANGTMRQYVSPDHLTMIQEGLF